MTDCLVCGMEKIKGLQTMQYCISDIQDAMNKMRIDSLHEIGLTGKGIKIGILDSGIRSDHPMLSGKVSDNSIQIAPGNKFDGAGHGTHIAGILSQIASKSKLFNIKVLDDNTNGTFADIMMGIEIGAYDMDLDILNLSLGSYIDRCLLDNVMCQLIDKVVFEKNVAVVCAAGNGGPGVSPTIPAASIGAIAVGSCNDNLTTSNWSSRGPFCGMHFPDCAAIGSDIYSAWINNGCKSNSGTSMASPMVSGLIALLMEAKNKRFTRMELEYILKEGCVKI